MKSESMNLSIWQFSLPRILQQKTGALIGNNSEIWSAVFWFIIICGFCHNTIQLQCIVCWCCGRCCCLAIFGNTREINLISTAKLNGWNIQKKVKGAHTAIQRHHFQTLCMRLRVKRNKRLYNSLIKYYSFFSIFFLH